MNITHPSLSGSACAASAGAFFEGRSRTLFQGSSLSSTGHFSMTVPRPCFPAPAMTVIRLTRTPAGPAGIGGNTGDGDETGANENQSRRNGDP